MVILYLLLISLMARPSAGGSEDGDAVGTPRDNLAQPLVGVAKLGSPMDEEDGITPFSPSERGYQAPHLVITSDDEFNSSLAAGKKWTLAHAKYFVEENNRVNGRKLYQLSNNNDGIIFENSRHGLIVAHVYHHGHDEAMLDAYSKALAAALDGEHGKKYREMLDNYAPHADGNLVSFVKDYLKTETDTSVVSAEMIAADVARILQESAEYKAGLAQAELEGKAEEFRVAEEIRLMNAFRDKLAQESVEKNVNQHRRRPGTKPILANLKRKRADYANYLGAPTSVPLENEHIFHDHNVPMLVPTKAS